MVSETVNISDDGTTTISVDMDLANLRTLMIKEKMAENSTLYKAMAMVAAEAI